MKSINARNASVKAARAGEYVEVVLPMELHFLWPGVVPSAALYSGLDWIREECALASFDSKIDILIQAI